MPEQSLLAAASMLVEIKDCPPPPGVEVSSEAAFHAVFSIVAEGPGGLVAKVLSIVYFLIFLIIL